MGVWNARICSVPCFRALASSTVGHVRHVVMPRPGVSRQVSRLGFPGDFPQVNLRCCAGECR